MEFRCGLSTANSTELCFAANASCVDLGSYGQACSNCPPGFTHDFSFGHFPTCSLSENFYKILFAALSPYYFIALFLLIKLSFKLKSDIRRLCYVLIMTGIIHWIWSLCLYLENGFFEASIFFHIVILDHAIFQASLYELFFLTPVYAALHLTSLNRVKLLMSLRLLPDAILVTVFGILLIVHARSSPTVFNYYFLMYIGIGFVFSVVNTTIVIREGRRLQGLIKNSIESSISGPNTSKLAFLLGRLQQHERMIKTSMGPLLLNNVYMIVALSVTGSIPYCFVLVTIHLSAVALSAFPAYRFLNPKSKDQQPTGENISQVVVVVPPAHAERSSKVQASE